MIPVDDMLCKVKQRLEITGTEQDAVLTQMIEDAAATVLNYCHITALPWQLEHVVRAMAVAAVKAEGGDNVASIKRGDTQITYNQVITADMLTTTQRQELNGFRRVRIR